LIDRLVQLQVGSVVFLSYQLDSRVFTYGVLEYHHVVTIRSFSYVTSYCLVYTYHVFIGLRKEKDAIFT